MPYTKALASVIAVVVICAGEYGTLNAIDRTVALREEPAGSIQEIAARDWYCSATECCFKGLNNCQKKDERFDHALKSAAADKLAHR